MPIKPPRHSFGITTCGEMLAKLERELERIARSTFDAQDVVDHSINCALTSWHMVDWVWQLHFRNNPSAQERLAAAANMNRPRSKSDGASRPKWVKDAFLKLCAGLKDMEAIAIGSKHVYPEVTPTELVEAYVSARTPPPFVLGVSKLGEGDVLAGEDGSVPPRTQYLPKIEKGEGTTQIAIQVSDSTVLFWKQFLKDFGIP